MLNFKEIQWPIYPINKETQIITLGTQKLIEVPSGETRVLDDLAFKGNLAQRRLAYELHYELFKKKLFKLKGAIFRFEGLIHHTKTNKFIDSSGRIFIYQKEDFFKLKYHKIVKFVESPHGYAVEVKDVHCRFFIPMEPSINWLYAGILEVGRGYVLYCFSDKKEPDTRRKL